MIFKGFNKEFKAWQAIPEAKRKSPEQGNVRVLHLRGQGLAMAHSSHPSRKTLGLDSNHVYRCLLTLVIRNPVPKAAAECPCMTTIPDNRQIARLMYELLTALDATMPTGAKRNSAS